MENFKITFDIDPDLIAQANNLTSEEFLAGPGRDRDDIVIDPIFATTLPTAIADLALDAELTLENGHPVECATWAIIATTHSYIFKEVVDPVHGLDYGVSVHERATDRIVGLYTGCTLVVDPDHRGCRLGCRLVQLRFLHDGDLPLWQHDEAGFTPAGEAAHLSACHSLESLRPH